MSCVRFISQANNAQDLSLLAFEYLTEARKFSRRFGVTA